MGTAIPADLRNSVRDFIPPLKLVNKILFDSSLLGTDISYISPIEVLNDVLYVGLAGVKYPPVEVGGSVTGIIAVLALNLTSNAIIWKYVLTIPGFSNPFVSPFAISHGALYFMNPNGVYALNVANGTLLWSVNIENVRFGYAPAVTEGKIYVCGFDGIEYLYALNATNGNLLWRFPMETTPGHPPVANNEMVYVGEGELYAINAKTGRLKWTADGTASLFYNLGVYAISSAQIVAYNADNGSVLWIYNKKAEALKFVNGLIYAKTSPNCIDVLNATTGTLVKSCLFEFGFDFFTVENGVLYAHGGEINGPRLLAFNLSTCELIWCYFLKSQFFVPPIVVSQDTLYYVSSPPWEECYHFSPSDERSILVFNKSQEWWNDSTNRNDMQKWVEPVSGWTKIRILWSCAPITVMTNSSVSIVIFNTTAGQLTIIVAGVEGTTGYMNISAPKAFIPQAEDIKIYLNSAPVNFNFTIKDQYAVAELTYEHSKHELKLSFPVWIGDEPNLTLIKEISSTPTTPWHYLALIIISVLIIILCTTIFFLKRIKKRKL
jgi:outer membrane protein assembly factor BamB